MNNAAKTGLLQKKRELLSDLKTLKEEARETGATEVRDSVDQATIDEFASEALQEVLAGSYVLEQIDEALNRIERGTYGICEACGRPIPEERLKAVPWTPYCLEDQEKLAG